MFRREKHRGFLIFLLALTGLHILCAQPNGNEFRFMHYTNEDGLPSSYVKSITQDPYGFIWLATRVSVCRFDGTEFREFPAYDDAGEPVELMADEIALYNDTLLVCRSINGEYYYFDFDYECYRFFSLLNDLGPFQALEYSEQGGFWFILESRLHYLDLTNNQVLELHKKEPFPELPENGIPVYYVKERNGKLVLVTGLEEIWVIDRPHRVLNRFRMPDMLIGEFMNVFYLDGYDHAWMGTSSDGLCRMNLVNGQVSYFNEDSGEGQSLLHNLTHCMTEDLTGRIWIGTEDGLCVWSPVNESFSYSQYNLTNPEGLNTNPIYSAFCDRDGNVWLGTYMGGINLWSAEEEFFTTWRAGTGQHYLGGNVVSCFEEDVNGNLWIGLEDLGLNMLDVSTGVVRKYRHQAGRNSLSFNNLHDLLFETPERLWIATYTGGINIMNIRTERFEYINTETHPQLPSNNVYCFLRHNDSILIGTTAGVGVYDLNTGKLKRFYDEVFNGILIESVCKTENRIWFSSRPMVYYYDMEADTLVAFDRIPHFKGINFIKKDSRNRVWIGDSYEGLCYYDEKADTLVYFNSDSGFPVSWIFSLEESVDNWFWASSGRGLVKFNPETRVYKLFDNNSGIPFNQFNYRASFKDSRGTVYFGGNNGMVSFNETVSRRDDPALEVVFTGMQLFNQPVKPGKDSPLKKSINRVSEVELRYKENVFTIEYTAFNYAYRGRCQYAYYLENFENSWNYVGNRRFATYTNLKPGEYYLHVMASKTTSDWENPEKVLKIIIKPPFWLTHWAFLIYFMLVGAILAGIYLISTRIQKSKALVEIERKERKYAAEMNQMKIEFFTNVSHELRTPLTMIMAPLYSIMHQDHLSPGLRKKLVGVERNVNRLLTLINQLLEFRKIENGKEHLSVSRGDIHAFAEEIRDSFVPVAESKNIQFILEKPEQPADIWFDHQKLEKVLFNLLSNAFKFTEEGGKITLSFRIVNVGPRKKKPEQYLLVSVSDTGQGIEPDMVDKIFDRFFQVDNRPVSLRGSGIGLAFVKSLVTLHRGEISVNSKVGVGTEFTVRLPVSEHHYAREERYTGNEQFISSTDKYIDVDPDFDEKPAGAGAVVPTGKPSVLVIDDNRELIEFIQEHFNEKYRLHVAYDGHEGLKQTIRIKPELVISDIMMPGMDGLELTRRLKTQLETSHIPVILLTAKGGVEERYRGLRTGADYYVEKPFYPHILEQIIQNILSTRRHLIEQLKKDALMPPSEVAHSDADCKFIEDLTRIIRQNIDKSTLDVSFIIKEMGISRSLLHLKLKNLTDCSTTEFIRSVRLREAARLISEGKCNISEAAYQTGFSSAAYFTRRFKEYFGKSPRDYFFHS